MASEPQIDVTFQGMEPSPALRADIEQHARRMLRFAPRMLACHVVVRLGEAHHQTGNRYFVHARATLPGGEVEAGRTATPDQTHADPYVAVRDTFDALRRQLEDFVRVKRGDVKTHASARGRVREYDPDTGFGVIVAADGHEVAFHRNSIVGGREDAIADGARVRFHEVEGETGPWASTVHPPPG